ncbi:hypothetical protein TPHA_0H00670 [Tetrapisispora phaffii CBS 4417]|uniref:Repressor of RNA polymerase III transcription MAF1 n=1 Tax=Tetrapisispora phaffii (strain ATCC 24235 / CBS 4417 / NBRC 1672 / NRRL Y-8282 / UCD 70-5) TaxID=1071381 RepID=G8BWX3_TETPH|nr:hypothetical protein TPHA_0H00670 [Tetrapisispora phaffii CBS 4417]CCE64277.1 hypothetical protein TPHA_0H00670 [Tetrapisispora phaffii CBS 4417]
MKFIDELDVERVNQSLNFETADCKITGSCDIFTTKAVASDKKLYKTIDNHLNELLQENENYNLVIQQRKNSVIDIASESEDAIVNTSSNSLNIENGQNSPADKQYGKQNINSFWEQKRRLSVNDNDDQAKPNFFVRTNKLNDQNLKELVSENDYVSSSSVESVNLTKRSRHASNSSISSNISNNTSSNNNSNNNNNNNNNNNDLKSDDSKVNTFNDTTLQNNNKFKVTKTHPNRRRSSIQDAPPNISIGPFGPISETASRRTFAYLIAILNASYPDHDFSSLEPTNFVKSTIKQMVSKIENSLYSLGKKPDESMWEIINSHMDFSDSVIYEYDPSKLLLDDEPGYLWSLNWFIFNKKRKRVAYIYLTCVRLQNNLGELNKDNIPLMSKKEYVIDHDSNNFEGEYDLAVEENAIEDDSDMDVAVN